MCFYTVGATGDINAEAPMRARMLMFGNNCATIFHRFLLITVQEDSFALAPDPEDLELADGQMRVIGKGNKKLPLHPDNREVLGHYLRLERPLTNTPALFVSLKGRQRGQPHDRRRLRSLFRHHRVQSRVRRANPHRLRA